MIGEFVPARLIEARTARGISAAGLAELLGVSPGAVSHWETGKYAPRQDSLEAIAEKLNLPEWFFRRPSMPLSAEPIFWRSFAYATRTARGRCECRFQWLKEVVGYLNTHLEFPSLNVPLLSTSESVVDFTREQIEEHGRTLRRAWKLGEGPIADVVLSMENNGIVVARSSLGTEALDAFCQWGNQDPRPIVVLGTDKSSARSRLDAAHELAHLVLHRRFPARVVSNPALKKIIEAQAFNLAGAFLMPEQSFVGELWAPTLDAFRSLKERWKVSIGAMIQRAAFLEVITEEQHRRLWMAYSRRGWRDTEPVDDKIAIEHPRLLRRSFAALFEHGIKTPEQLLLDLPYADVDIEALAGLPSGALKPDPRDGPTVSVRPGPERGSIVVPFNRPSRGQS